MDELFAEMESKGLVSFEVPSMEEKRRALRAVVADWLFSTTARYRKDEWLGMVLWARESAGRAYRG